MKRPILILLLFLICTASSFFMKTCHYNQEAVRIAFQVRDKAPVWHGGYDRMGRPGPAQWQDMLPTPRPNFMPFTIESAMMFTYSSDVAEGRGVPAKDQRLAYLPEVAPYAQMNMLLEWVLGWTWRAYSCVFKPAPPTKNELRFQDNPAFARFTAVEVRIWTALISGLVFLWLVVLRTPLRYAFAGGMFHAVSAASIARATGQDIVRGDLCIPLFLGCLVTACWIIRKPSRWKYILLILLVFASFIAWDLCQMLFGAWLLYELLRILSGGRVTEKRRNIWIVISAAIVLNALVIPFNVTYGLIMSQLVCVFLPLLMLMMFFRQEKIGRRFFLFFGGLGVLLCVYYGLIDNPGYRANYSHFAEVMKAKIIFKNQKPLNPEALSYDARMMWTPSMHSATWGITTGFFPSLGSVPGLSAISGPTLARNVWNFLPLTLAAYFLILLAAGLFTVFREPLLRDLPRSMLPHLFTIGFLIGFIYIVRYHEFLIIFLSAAFALLAQSCFRGVRSIHKPALKRCLSILFVCWFSGLLLFELVVSARCRTRNYDSDVYYREITQMIEWLRQGKSMRGKTILTEFGVGPMLMAYCGVNLVLQPQFGMEAIRHPVEEYLRIMYHGTEKELAAFCDRYHVDYLLYDHGAVGPLYPDSMRYIANGVEIDPESPVARMEYRPDTLRHFYQIYPPQKFRYITKKYLLFKYISSADIIEAEKLLQKTADGKKRERRECAERAIVLDPRSEMIRNFYINVVQQIPEPGLLDFQRGKMRSGGSAGTR